MRDGTCLNFSLITFEILVSSSIELRISSDFAEIYSENFSGELVSLLEWTEETDLADFLVDGFQH